jgi:hypothetical protein
MLGRTLHSLGIELEPVGFDGLLDLITSYGGSNLSHPWEIAWALREFVPSVQTAHGDWGPIDQWPAHNPSRAHVNWWTGEFSRLMAQDPSLPLSINFPKAISLSQIETLLEKIPRGTWVEVFQMPQGPPPHRTIEGPFSKFDGKKLWLGNDCQSIGYDISAMLRRVVSIETRPAPTGPFSGFPSVSGFHSGSLKWGERVKGPAIRPTVVWDGKLIR